MRFTVTLLAFISLISMSWAQGLRFENHTLFVKLKPNTEMPMVSGIDRVEKLFNDVYLLHTQDAVLVENQLIKEASVVYTEKNYYAGQRQLPAINKSVSPKSFTSSQFNDPQVGRIWSFNDESRFGISVEKAYSSALPQHQASKIIVAVVDTGIDYTHEDLKDVMWVNEKEIAGNNIDDDNNGYIDDVHGINTLERNSSGQATGNPKDGHYHGTHVAGTIAATQNNMIGIAGIAGHVELMAIRTVPSNGDETDRDVVESYLYAGKMGAKLINCSFGKALNEGGMIVSEAIKHIGDEYGVLVVAAAGNDSTMFSKFDIDTNLRYPASYQNDHLLVIAATQSSGGLASFSNVGKKNVDVAAPGAQIFSTMPNNAYGNLSGTSMATPTTVGVAAQVLAYYPDLSPLELKKALIDSVVKVNEFSQYMVSGGRVDLARALDSLK
jgi:thermitase